MPKKKQKVPKAQSPVPHDQNSVAMNSCGLPIFPAELLLEIMTHFPRPSDLSFNDPSIPRWLEVTQAEEYLAWREVSSALSQTCKGLRLFFRLYLWLHIEIWEGMVIQGQKLRSWLRSQAAEKEYNLELVRQLEIVTVRDPTLAEYVQIVDVDVARYSGNSVLLELPRCISLFPNLRVVKLRVLRTDHRSSGVPKMVEKAFNKYSYPQLSTAIISKWVYPFLSSCPDLRFVRWMDASCYTSFFWKFWPSTVTVLQFCSQLEIFALWGEDCDRLEGTQHPSS